MFRRGGVLAYTLAMIITIDGPAGVGKSTAAKQLARALGVAHLDTGATYRAVTLKALRTGADMDDEAALVKIAEEMDLRMEPTDEGARVFMDGCDVSAAIRTQEVSDNTYLVAQSPAVRSVLVDLQRRLGGQLGDFVTEGRDQGSVVFNEADVKFYLDACPEVRARRRHEELLAGGGDVTYRQVFDAIGQRDGRDMGRAVAPLVKPQGAIEIDTSQMSIEQVTAELLRHVQAAR